MSVPDVFEAQDSSNRNFYFKQQGQVEEFQLVHGSISDLFSSLTISIGFMDYDSFSQSGLYDEEFLEARRQAIFLGEAQRSMSRGLTMTFFPSATSWRSAADGNIDILGMILFYMISITNHK